MALGAVGSTLPALLSAFLFLAFAFFEEPADVDALDIDGLAAASGGVVEAVVAGVWVVGVDSRVMSTASGVLEDSIHKKCSIRSVIPFIRDFLQHYEGINSGICTYQYSRCASLPGHPQ